MTNTKHSHMPDEESILSKPSLKYQTRDLLKQCREMVASKHTFNMALDEKHVINFINNHLPDGNRVEGIVNGVTDGKIVIEVTEHEGPIAEEYGTNQILLGDVIWLSKFGCESVDNVSMKNGLIHATLFSELRMRQEIIGWLKNHDHDTYIELISNDDADYLDEIYEYFLENCEEPIGKAKNTIDNKEPRRKQNHTTKYSNGV